MEIKAYCYSRFCAKNRFSTKPVLKVNVKMGECYCPDCRMSLVWTKEKSYLGARRRLNKKYEEQRKDYFGMGVL